MTKNFDVKNIINIDDQIKQHLLSYQIDHIQKLANIINLNVTALDNSDTGTGKTYCAMALCAQLKLVPIIICPKAVMTNWRRVAEIFKLKPLFIVNYETIKAGKYYNVEDKRIKCPNITVFGKTFEWNVEDNNIFIFDEAHRCSFTSLNGQLLIAAKKVSKNILLLSATIADDWHKFIIFTYILNFVNLDKKINPRDIDLKKYFNMIYNWLATSANPLLIINHVLFPKKAARIKISELGDLFPETQITAEPYNMGANVEKEIEKQYDVISDALDNLKMKKAKDKQNPLVLMLRAQQKIELLKIPTIVDLAKDFLTDNYSIAIFVNFSKSLLALAELLKTTCLIHGKQTVAERDTNINNFQENKSRIIICNIQAGAVGISLHDVHKTHPRVSIISPSWNGTSLSQCLGRVHRSGGTKSLQRIVYCANTIEDKIAKKVKTKLSNIAAINDGDFDVNNVWKETSEKQNLVTSSEEEMDSNKKKNNIKETSDIDIEEDDEVYSETITSSDSE
jgi:superfamily II DNA or RNA helicase